MLQGPRVPPKLAGEETVGAVVYTLTATVEEAEHPVATIVAGLKAHEEPAGRPVQEKLTVPV